MLERWQVLGRRCHPLLPTQLWERHPFADTNDGSDTGYLWEAPAKRVGVLADASFYVALLHGGNASPAAVEGPDWRPCPPEEVARLTGEDWAFYRTLEWKKSRVPYE